ncbi:MAG TPA: FAD-dependent oxidoreductase [Caulobacteraceae bacterium]|jgi:monoamine oxidase
MTPAATSDVIVVGAGFAGLKAASELVALGRSVTVLEADSRVGGRTRRGEVAGRVVDFGGQWVGPRHATLLAEARRLGIATYDQYDDGQTTLLLRGRLARFTGDVPKMSPLALVELAWLQRRWDRETRTVPADAPWTAPNAAEWDSQTLDTWIGRHLRTAEARAFARLVPKGAWASDASQVSYLWFLDALRSGEGLAGLMAVKGGVLEKKFEGGMQQIAARLADELGERVVLEAPVRRIVQDEAGVTVETDKGAYQGRFVIVATPPGPAIRIEYRPHLPAAHDMLRQRMGMGSIIKATVAYETAFWREAGFSGQVATDDDTLGIVMDDVQAVGPPMLLCFIEGAHAVALSGATQAVRREQVLASLARFFGEPAAHPVGYGDNDWQTEPWTHGYVGAMPPGAMTRYGPALRQPFGRIHWAGAETSAEWQGYLEGAMLSGKRAAAEVAARHNT